MECVYVDISEVRTTLLVTKLHFSHLFPSISVLLVETSCVCTVVTVDSSPRWDTHCAE